MKNNSLLSQKLTPSKGHLIRIACGMAMLIMFGALSISQLVSHQETIVFQSLISCLIAFFSYGFYLLATSLLDKTTKWMRRMAFAIGLLLLYIVQVTALSLIYAQTGWDVYDCLAIADEFFYDCETGPLLNYYPNNTLLVFWNYAHLFLADLFNVYDTSFFFLCSNILMVDIAFFFSCLIGKRVLHSKGLVIYIILSCLLFLFSPWLTVSYTDTLCMPFPMIGLYCYLKHTEAKKRWQRFFFLSIMALSFSVGYLFKPTPIILMIAIFIIYLFAQKPPLLKRVAVIVLSVVVVFASSQIMLHSMQGFFQGSYNKEESERIRFPVTHFLMMGLNTDNGNYGAYSGADVALTESVDGQDAKRKLNMQIYKERMQELGFFNYLSFLAQKMVYTFNDGNFNFTIEGAMITDPPYDYSPLGKALQEIYTGDKSLRALYEIYANSVWFVILVLIAFACLIKSSYKSNLVAILRLCVLGLALFLMLFETRSRYLFWCAPIFAMLAATGAMGLPLLKQKSKALKLGGK